MSQVASARSRADNMYFAKRVLASILLITTVLFIAHIALKYISVVTYNEQHGFFFELSNRFDFNDENSVPQWFTQFVFLGIGVAGFTARFLTSKKQEKRFWMVIGLLGVLLSVDDVATLHEFILQSIHNVFFIDSAPTFLRNAWLLLLPFILIGFGWMCVSMFKLLPRRTTILCVMSGMVFIFGAVVVDSIVNKYPLRSFEGQGLLGGLEGGLQLLGSSLFLYALIAFIEQKHGVRIKDALKGLKRSN